MQDFQVYMNLCCFSIKLGVRFEAFWCINMQGVSVVIHCGHVQKVVRTKTD